jgi:spore coat protein CotH
MLAHKHIVKIIALIMSLAVACCLLLLTFSDQLMSSADQGISMDYEEKLFNTDSIISINILMDEDDWNDMLENAIEEEYYECDVEINGETFYKVGIRPKGNTSLSSIANDSTTDRYSFKLEFDHYVEGQTCHGLDKLILNNNYADATNMKEALIYDLYQFMGVDASLYNYASISMNGNYKGLYLALEGVEDSFALRNYGTQSGQFYKPESTEMGEGMETGGNNGADLNYSNDDADSYSAIWDSALSDVSDSDKERVITALKNISEGRDLESYMDIDNLLAYMAVHVFSVNEDSLTGNMAHNYYLYESNGMLNLIPWDYNLCFGGMGMNGETDATSLVNDPIDNAFSGTTFFDSLLADENYQSQYYAYLEKLVEEYVEGGGFDAFYERVRSQIDDLVESDPTAFYSYNEYEEAADTLYQIVKLRGESVQGQVEGSIPSTEEEQKNSDALIDASDLDVSSMGSMNSSDMNFGGMDAAGMNAGEMFGKEMNPAESGDAGFDNNKGGADMAEAAGQEQGGMPGQNGFMPQQDGGMPEGFEDFASGDAGGDMGAAFGDESGDMGTAFGEVSSSSNAFSKSDLLLCGISALILIAALAFAACYHRKPRIR